MSGINSLELVVGCLASISIFTIWLFTFHKKFIVSLVNTPKVNTFGVYTDFGEALRTHFWYLLRALIPSYREPDRRALEDRVKKGFLDLVTKGTIHKARPHRGEGDWAKSRHSKGGCV